MAPVRFSEHRDDGSADLPDQFIGKRQISRIDHEFVPPVALPAKLHTNSLISKELVELRGIEPLTSAVRLQRSPI